MKTGSKLKKDTGKKEYEVDHLDEGESDIEDIIAQDKLPYGVNLYYENKRAVNHPKYIKENKMIEKDHDDSQNSSTDNEPHER